MGDFCSGFSTRSNENFTLSAVNGSPLWNLTPRRSLSSQVVGLTLVTDSARWGAGCQGGFEGEAGPGGHLHAQGQRRDRLGALPLPGAVAPARPRQGPERIGQ